MTVSKQSKPTSNRRYNLSILSIPAIATAAALLPWMYFSLNTNDSTEDHLRRGTDEVVKEVNRIVAAGSKTCYIATGGDKGAVHIVLPDDGGVVTYIERQVEGQGRVVSGEGAMISDGAATVSFDEDFRGEDNFSHVRLEGIGTWGAEDLVSGEDHLGLGIDSTIDVAELILLDQLAKCKK